MISTDSCAGELPWYIAEFDHKRFAHLSVNDIALKWLAHIGLHVDRDGLIKNQSGRVFGLYQFASITPKGRLLIHYKKVEEKQ